MPELRDLLGGDPPASVQAFDEHARAALVAVLVDARDRQAQAIDEALAATMRHVPFPVRGIVKKVLFG